MVSKIKIYKNFEILRKHQNAMILIGNFDGLHLGHQRLFKEAKKYKKKYLSSQHPGICRVMQKPGCQFKDIFWKNDSNMDIEIQNNDDSENGNNNA